MTETPTVRIRRASVEDAADVMEIERSCPEVSHWSEGVWARVLAQTASYDVRYGAERCCLVAEHLVGQHLEKVVGFVVLNVVAGCIEIESLAVPEFARRHGVGTRLCQQAALWGQSRGAVSLQLEVRATNAGAAGLYATLGFREQGRRKDYYRDPVEDAVLLSAPLDSPQDSPQDAPEGRPIVTD